MHPTITRRLSFRSVEPRDRARLDRLAALDSARPLESPVLVAEVGNSLVAAIGGGGEVIADPFVPTASLVRGLRRIRESLAA